MMTIFKTFLVLVLLWPGLARAEEGVGKLSIELNTAEPLDAACRLSFLLRNETGQDIEQLVVETVLFSGEGQVILLTLFDFADLPPGRPRVRQFEVPNLACADLGMVLINGADTCTGDGLDPARCERALSLSSRAGIALEG